MTIPLITSASSPGDGGPPGPMRIALPFLLGGAPAAATAAGGALSVKQGEIVLAVWAAASLVDEGEALKTARLARDKPEHGLTPAFNGNAIKQVVAAVRSAQDDPQQNVAVTDEHKAVAATVGANSRLVAIAHEVILAHRSGADARHWAIRLLDSAVAERAARGAGRNEALAVLGAVDATSMLKALASMQEQIDALNKQAGLPARKN
jgi:hypothetical protein